MMTLLFASPFLHALPVFVVKVYGRDSDAFGLLVSMLGVGALTASLVVATLGNWRRSAFLIAGGVFSSSALILAGMVPLFHAGMVFMFLLGVGNVSNLTLSQTLLMDHVEDEFRGRVASVLSMSTTVVALGLIPMGMALDMFGGRTVALSMGFLLLLGTSVILVTQEHLRRLD